MWLHYLVDLPRNAAALQWQRREPTAGQEVVHRRRRLHRPPHQAMLLGRSCEVTSSEVRYKAGSQSAALLCIHFVAAAVLDLSCDARALCAQEAHQRQWVPRVFL